jgi:hypothetical protein
MTYEELRELAASLALDVRIRRVWPGLARKYKELRGKLARHRIAEFPLVLLEKKSGTTGL